MRRFFLFSFFFFALVFPVHALNTVGLECTDIELVGINWSSNDYSVSGASSVYLASSDGSSIPLFNSSSLGYWGYDVSLSPYFYVFFRVPANVDDVHLQLQASFNAPDGPWGMYATYLYPCSVSGSRYQLNSGQRVQMSWYSGTTGYLTFSFPDTSAPASEFYCLQFCFNGTGKINIRTHNDISLSGNLSSGAVDLVGSMAINGSTSDAASLTSSNNLYTLYVSGNTTYIRRSGSSPNSYYQKKISGSVGSSVTGGKSGLSIPASSTSGSLTGSSVSNDYLAGSFFTLTGLASFGSDDGLVDTVKHMSSALDQVNSNLQGIFDHQAEVDSVGSDIGSASSSSQISNTSSDLASGVSSINTGLDAVSATTSFASSASGYIAFLTSMFSDIFSVGDGIFYWLIIASIFGSVILFLRSAFDD